MPSLSTDIIPEPDLLRVPTPGAPRIVNVRASIPRVAGRRTAATSSAVLMLFAAHPGNGRPPRTRRKNATTDHGSNVRIAVSGRVLVATADLPLVLSWAHLMSAGSCTLTG